MPKSSPIQTNFSGGEFGPHIEGRVELERAETGAEEVINYLPTLEGPLIRRPGFKHVALAKDATKPPRFIPFKFSNTDQYLLEVGERYIRFYTNEGRVVTSGTSYIVVGVFSPAGTETSFQAPFTASRTLNKIKKNEILNFGFSKTVFSSVVSGSILEIPTVYDHNMIANIGFAQKGDTLWLMHSSIPTFTLQRFGAQDWDLKYFTTKDGPYLNLNSYKETGDSNANIRVINAGTENTKAYIIRSHSSVTIDTIINASSQLEVWTTAPHKFTSGDRVWINGVVGTTEANNGSSLVSGGFVDNFTFNFPRASESSVWTVQVISATSIVLLDSVFTNAYSGSGRIYPALFKFPEDQGRNIGLYINGHRHYGHIWAGSALVNGNQSAGPTDFVFVHPIQAIMSLDPDSKAVVVGSTVATAWQMGSFSRHKGWPSSGTFHQDRLVMTGIPGLPTEFDASKTGVYNNFAAAEASSLIVADDNALQFNLISDSQDQLKWVRSGEQGLYLASESSEFLVSPSRDGQALTPTNISNDHIGEYGSSDVEPVKSGEAFIYIQTSGRKVRELRFFANLQSHRSTNLSILSDHTPLPSILGLGVQKEFYPTVWAYKSDGNLVSMSYSREESQVVAGWARHTLGGRSDRAYSPPKIKALEVMRSSTGKYDQVWVAAERYINGSTVCSIEYMTEPYRHRDETQKQRDAFYLDCGATYDSSLVIVSVTQGSALITATNHGLVTNDRVLVTDVVGLNSSLINADGVVCNSNLVNDKYFIVKLNDANSFWLQDANSSIIETLTYAPYIGGGKVRKLVSSVSGLDWLKNEEVDILADGGYAGKAIVNSSGTLTLPAPAAVVQVGYGYSSRLKTLVKDRGSQTGSAIGMMQKAYQIALRVRDVGDLYYSGVGFRTMHAASFLNADEYQVDQAMPLFTGIHHDSIESDVGFYGQVYLEQRNPLPGMIQSITFMMDETDR